MASALDAWLAPYIAREANAPAEGSANVAPSPAAADPQPLAIQNLSLHGPVATGSRPPCDSDLIETSQLSAQVADVANVATDESQHKQHPALSRWARGLAQLDPWIPRGDVPPKRWQIFVSDAALFLNSTWAIRAIELGWGPLDLLGCDRERPFARIDHAGLLWLLEGRMLVALITESAAIATPSGGRLTYYRQPIVSDRVVLPWQLSAVLPRSY